jgi:hypothetical protein
VTRFPFGRARGSSPARMPSPRAWLGIGAVVWGVVLVVGASWSAHSGKPTVREQTTIVQAVPNVDRALSTVVTAGKPAGPVIEGYVRTQSSCEAGNRTGQEYRRTVYLYTQPGTEAALLRRVADGLPDSYHSVSVTGQTLTADTGYFVELVGAVQRPGEVRFVADTGCRVVGGTVPRPDPDVPTAGPAAPAAGDLLHRLGGGESGHGTAHLGCASTVTLTAPKPAKTLVDATPPGATLLINTAELVVYRTDTVGVVGSLSGDTLRVSATAPCQ